MYCTCRQNKKNTARDQAVGGIDESFPAPYCMDPYDVMEYEIAVMCIFSARLRGAIKKNGNIITIRV